MGEISTLKTLGLAESLEVDSLETRLDAVRAARSGAVFSSTAGLKHTVSIMLID